MATYASVNGKAPSGLSVGDKVVTNGGTYTITGVNSNGSYTSSKTSSTTKSTYTGNYSTAPSASSSSSSSSSKPAASSSSSSGSSYSGSSSSGSSYSGSSSSGSSGGRVLQSVNGKAPAGAQIGDYIVTNGGTYQITGGSAATGWTSQKVSDANKSTGYTPTSSGSSGTPGSGAVTGIGVYTSQQQKIKDEMAANSLAWHNAATKEEKDALHMRNIELANQLAALGVYSSYDASTGKWTGETAEPTLMMFEQSIENGGTYIPTDNSEYLRQMAAEYLKQQQEALASAYNTNLSNLQAEQDKLAGQYDTARNTESVNDALARQRWNETAAAYGLNSGTQGQAQLAFSTQRQANLSQIQQAEAAANAEVERQRTLLGQQYQSAMTQALAANNYQLFQQLYNEAVRLDQATQNQKQFDASMALKQYQTALDQYNANRTFDFNKQVNDWQQAFQEQQQRVKEEQWNKDYQFDQDKWAYQKEQDAQDFSLGGASILASGGDYSAYGKLYGWDQETIDRMNAMWQMQQLAAASSKSSSKSSSGSKRSGGGGSGGVTPTASMYGDALNWAAVTGGNAVDYLKVKYGISNDKAKSGLEVYTKETTSQTGFSDTGFQGFMRSVFSNLQSGDTSYATKAIEDNWTKMTLAQQNIARKALNSNGLSYTP